MRLTKGQDLALSGLYGDGNGDWSLRQAQSLYRCCYESASDDAKRAGLTWYENAMAELRAGVIFPPNDATIACVAAHLSPRMSWSQNIRATHLMFNSVSLKPGWVMSAQWNLALQAATVQNPLATFSPAAIKTYQFARALIGLEACVVDTHMIHLSLGRYVTYHALSSTEFKASTRVLTPLLQGLAQEYDVPTSAFQATLWLQHKASK